MVPSSFMISQITEAGLQPAMAAKSQPASVWPARISTPPSTACSGKMWPGCTRSVGWLLRSTATCTVRARHQPTLTAQIADIEQQIQQQWAQTQPVQQPKAQPRVTEQPYQQPTRTAQSQPVQQQPKTQPQKQAAQPYQDLLQTPAHTTAQQPKTQQAAPVTKETEAPKQTAEKKDERRWMVQCGSFKGAEQAETVRAQLAFEGFDSRITTNNGWNRVVIGPLKGKDNASNMIERLKMAGHANCIRLAARG